MSLAWSWGSLRLLAGAGLCVSCVVVACATGGGAGSDDEGGTTNQGGANGGTTSVGGNGGNVGVGGSGGEVSTCSEDPCKLTLPQCGCASGEKCTWAADTGSCTADGNTDPGSACNAANTCKAGSHCLNVGSLAVCKKYCADDTHCDAPGGLCVLQVDMTPGVPYQQKWCSDNCDPPSGVGCDAPNAKCELGKEQDGLMRYFTLCLPAGAGLDGAPCPNGYADCADGFGCIGLDIDMNPICLQWCNLATPSCQAGACTTFTPPVSVGNVTYGACL
jgi:hypothetical protein